MTTEERDVYISSLFLELDTEKDMEKKKEIAMKLLAELTSLYLEDEEQYLKWEEVFQLKSSQNGLDGEHKVT